MEEHIQQKEEQFIDDCWNKTGIWGAESPRCPKLDEVTHCQNCPVFSGSGRMLLDRKQPDGYSNEWTNVLTQKKDAALKTAISVIIFRVGDEWYALKTAVLKEITEMRHIHTIPHRKNSVLRGITSIRGELHLCVSIGHLFDITKAVTTKNNIPGNIMRDRIIVIEKNSERFVFPTNEILGIYRFSPDRVNPPPSTLSEASSSYVNGVIEHKDKHIGCLDEELLFHAFSRKIS